MASDGGELLELQCPICYGEQNEAGFATLLCGHVFHDTCLKKALKLRAQCPTCRCPAKTTDPKCICRTGQPIKLFHLQRPRGENPSQPGLGCVAASGLDGTVAATALAAAEQRAAQREAKLREALQQERQRVSELELEVMRKESEVEKEQAKAERRKQRLATMEQDHQAAITRLVEEKSRLEAREREQSEELNRTRQALHKMRMDLEKTRASLYEREEAVMRLKREVAIQRARAGGAAALQPREMAELLGERKEDWQVVYSMKVEELRRAMDASTELKAALAKSATDADARVAAERLAGAERVKTVTQERDEAKRELMDLEYKLHEAERRLAELQRQQGPAGSTAGAGAGSSRTAAAGPTPFEPAGPPARPAQARPPPSGPTASWFRAQPDKQRQPIQSEPQPQTQQQQHWPAAHGGACSAGAGLSPARQEEDVGEEEEDELEALALMAMSCPVSDDEGGGPEDDEDMAAEDADGGGISHGGSVGDRAGASAKRDRDSVAAEHTAKSLGGGCGGSGGCGTSQDDLEYDDTPYDMAGAAEPDEAPPSGKRRRQGQEAGGGQMPVIDPTCDFTADLDNDPEPVPVLPRAFSGLFAGGASRPPAKPAAASGGRASGHSAPAARPGSVLSAAGAGFGGPSFAAKAGRSDANKHAYGARGGGSSLICEGPDGRGGTTRFPLTSSYTHNTLKAAVGGSKGSGSSGRGGGGSRSSGTGKHQPVAAAGRIDAFLRPTAQPNRR